jgi:RNA polymerase sigma-70 factor (ECF subfamily)
LHVHGFSQPHSGEQRHPSLAAAEQAQAARWHFLHEHSWVVLMTSSLFLEHATCSSMLTHASRPHYTRRTMNEPETPEVEVSAALVEKLVENHREFLGFLERRLGNRAEAEDILQEAFVKGVEHAGSVRDGESVVAWFYRALRNALIDHRRRRGAAGRAMDAFARELDDPVELPTEIRETVCACVRSLSETLKSEYAEALRRIDVDGLSVRAYAAEIGIEPNNAAVRVHRAREALRKRVMSSCGTCAEHGCLDCTCDMTCGPTGHG